MTEVTKEMIFALQGVRVLGQRINFTQRYAAAMIEAVAPLIEAQARAEIERLEREKAAALGLQHGGAQIIKRLETDLAQARAAAIEEADRAIKRAAWMAKHACLVEPDGGSPMQAECDLCDEAERRILSLLSRPVSEREGDKA